MFRFLKNLFKIGRKEYEQIPMRYRPSLEVYEEGDITVEIDREEGSMVVTSTREVSPSELAELFMKYVIGRD